MKLEELEMHPLLKQLLVSKGITKLYPPQEMAVKKGILDGKNILMVTETASGKTLLAIIVAINNVLTRGGKTVYLTPLKALAREIYEKLLEFETLGVRIAITVGNYDSADPYLDKYDVIVTTYEKMDSLLRHKPHWLPRVSLLIIDEIHYINDEKRGPVLESIIAGFKSMMSGVQLLGLSATIGNSDEIARWLEAEPIVSRWRPVPLREGVYYRGRIYYKDGEVEKIPSLYGNPVYDLISDSIRGGGQALVFVNSRRRAVMLSERTARRLSIPTSPEAKDYAQRMMKSSEITHLNKKLADLIEKGVSFHHAGLNYEQRKIIEEAFRRGLIKVVFATPTLAAGVNLPARRVIVEDYRRYVAGEGMNPIMVLEYKQFAGRAGRPGYDEYGDSILIARGLSETDFLLNYYLNGSPERIASKIGSESSLRKHVLAYIATMSPVSDDSLSAFIKNTLYTLQNGFSRIRRGVKKAIEFLLDNNFIVIENNFYTPTLLGKKVSEVYIDPLSAIYLFKGLRKTRRATEDLVLSLIAAAPDMPKLSVRKREVVPLEEILDTIPLDQILGLYDREDLSYDQLLSELKTMLFLKDWINEVPEQSIGEKYDLGPGDIRAYIETAEWIAYAFRRITEDLPEFRNVSPVFREVEERVRYGVKRELLELTRIPGIGRVRARRLYRAGYRTLESLKKAAPKDLLRIEGIGEETIRSIYTYLSSGHREP